MIIQSPTPEYAGHMLLPAATLLHRLQAQLDAMREARNDLPWWHRRARHVLSGAIAAYMVEIEDLKALMAKSAPTTDIMT